MKIELDILQAEALIHALNALTKAINGADPMPGRGLQLELPLPQADEKPKAKRGRKTAEPGPEPLCFGQGFWSVGLKHGRKAAEPEPEPQPELEQVPAVEAVAALEELKTPAPEPVVINTAIEPEQVEAPPTRDPLTLDQIKAHAIPLQQAGKLPEAKAWLAEHGAAALKDLAPEHYDAFDTWAKAQLA